MVVYVIAMDYRKDEKMSWATTVSYDVSYTDFPAYAGFDIYNAST